MESTALPLTLIPEKVLREKTQHIENVLTPEIQQLIADMMFTMKIEHGVGLAATQIGKSLRLAVIYAEGQRFTIINPDIITKSDEYIIFTEGCLSIPGKEFPILRHEKITVRYINEKGVSCKLKLKGFLAIVFQHEIDHLDGVVIADRFIQQADLRRRYDIT